MITLGVGQQRIFQPGDVSRVAIGEPEIADVKQVGSGSELLITGMGEGRTSLLVWRANGTRLSYAVVVRRQDPKGLVGERAYDCANVLCNPYRGIPRRDEIVHNEQRLLTNAGILAEETGIDLARVLAFTFAYTRPRRRRQVAEIVQDDPLYVSEEERPQTIIVRETPGEQAPQSSVRPRSVSQARRDVTRYEPE